MNSTTYKNLVRLLEKWPVDSTKTGRDFGEYLRHLVANSFAGVGSKRTEQLESWNGVHSSLWRIANDRHKKEYPVSNAASCTGLTEQQCHQAMSNELLEAFEEENKSFFKKYFTFRWSS